MYQFAKLVAIAAVLPPSGPILLIFGGLLIGLQRPKSGRLIILIGAIALYLSSIPFVVSQLIATFGYARSVNIEDAKRAQAIVVLAGGLRPKAQEYGGDTLNQLSLARVRYGATLARQTGLPILVTGGTPHQSTRSEADLMRQALEVEFKINVRWVEDQSANTQQSAINSAALLRNDGIARVLLVTHAFDEPRTRVRFEQNGIEVISAPTQIPLTANWTVRGFIPSADALTSCFYLGYEGLAFLADRLLPGR